MATPPEPLRLFDLDPLMVLVAPAETPPTASQAETSLSGVAPENLRDVDRDGPALRDAVVAAILVNDARRALSEAVAAARVAGHSWRAIGIATGIPYQTLHRNRRQPADRDARES